MIITDLLTTTIKVFQTLLSNKNKIKITIMSRLINLFNTRKIITRIIKTLS